MEDEESMDFWRGPLGVAFLVLAENSGAFRGSTGEDLASKPFEKRGGEHNETYRFIYGESTRIFGGLNFSC